MAEVSAVKAALSAQVIETPSWGYGNSGTRFKVFTQAGVPRDPFEKIADAAQVHAVTGVAPLVSLHIPWDKVDDYDALARHAAEHGVRIGMINSNTFQDDDYKLGSVAHPDAKIRRKAVDHLLECVDIMDATGSDSLKLWFADGTNYPGQDDIVARQDRLAEALAEVYDRLGEHQRMVLEYKLFEPAFYTTDVPDWGTSYAHCLKLGDKAQVVVDTGHHAPGTNIEFIVAILLREKKLGAFDFNSRFYADDDLMVGSADPFQLFRILHEVAKNGGFDPANKLAFLLREKRLGAFDFNSRFYADDDLMVGSADPFQLFRILHEVAKNGGFDPANKVAFMLDQCHNIEAKIPAIIRSVMNVQEATAKALLVDLDALKAAQQAGDVLGANAVLMDAYNTDVRPLLAELRQEMGLDPDPLAAYRASGYAEKIVAERVGGTQAGWGA